MVNPAASKGVAGHFVEQGLSQRKACRLAGVSRSSLCCQPRRAARDKALKRRLLALASRYPRYGYLMLHGLLRNEGVVINRKRVYRLYTEANLQLRTRKRKKLVRPRVAMALPERANQRWSMDFFHDQLVDSRIKCAKNILRYPIERASRRWTKLIRNWKAAPQRFMIEFPEWLEGYI